MTCSYETERIAEDRDRSAHNPEVTCIKCACPSTEKSRERRSEARWHVDARLRPPDSWSCLVPATFGKLARGAQGGVVSTWPVMTMTDQGDAIRVPVHVNVFQHGLAKMDESGCV
jgi:hypothetical protein